MDKNIYQSYQNEIYYLRKHGDILLQRIKHHEIRMNQKKRQLIYPTNRDLETMQRWVMKLLRMLACIKTYQIFQAQNILLTDITEIWFRKITNDKCFVLYKEFMSRLNGIQSVDFTVINN